MCRKREETVKCNDCQERYVLLNIFFFFLRIKENKKIISQTENPIEQLFQILIWFHELCVSATAVAPAIADHDDEWGQIRRSNYNTTEFTLSNQLQLQHRQVSVSITLTPVHYLSPKLLPLLCGRTPQTLKKLWFRYGWTNGLFATCLSVLVYCSI